MKIHKITLLFIFLGLTFQLFGQEKDEKYSGVFLDKNQWNLKGPVHKSYFRYSSLKDSLPKIFKKERFLVMNDYRGKRPNYLEFNRDGLQIVQKEKDFFYPFDSIDYNYGIITLFQPEIKDYNKKKQYRSILDPLMPTYSSELFIHINRDWNQYLYMDRNNLEETNRLFKDIYIYFYDKKGRVIKKDEYAVLSTRFDEKKNYKYTKDDLFITVLYKYDAKNRVIEQRVIGGNMAKKDSPLPFEFLDTHAYLVDEEVKISYKYDNKNRLTQIKFFGEGMLLGEENYTYHPTKGYLMTKLKMVEGTAAFVNENQRFILTYNEYGDIIKRENLPDFPEQVFTNNVYEQPFKTSITKFRYYTYEYDKYNNWIKCYMFLEGTPDRKPSLIAERKIEYYNE